MEKLIHAQITNFFEKFNLFFKIQFGFLKKRSTNDAVLEFTEFCCSSLNEKKSTATVLLDFSKAFDTIDRNILVKKLKFCGIRGKSNKWFCSYLANRRQYVEINDNKSITSTITCEVSQDLYWARFCSLHYNDITMTCIKPNLVHPPPNT